MKLSAPIFRLKRKAKILSREKKIPLHQALDHVAAEEGYKGWSLLATRLKASSFAVEMLASLRPGDLVLLGARPGQGKTLMSLRLAVEAMKRGRRAALFTLESTRSEIMDRFAAIGVEPASFDGLFESDFSDLISADHIMTTLASAPRGTLIVVDYLQLLDQKRANPELGTQVRALKAFAWERGMVFVFISQIDRSYDPSTKPFPDARDVRLPNPLDLRQFDKTCFLNKGEALLRTAA